MTNLKFEYLSKIKFKQFKQFLDSLDEERKSWSLDLQGFKDVREMYNNSSNVPFVILCLDGNSIVGLVSINVIVYNNIKNDLEFKSFKNKGFKNGAMISFVVKKEYQGKNIGTQLLIQMEDVLKQLDIVKFEFIVAKHFKDNLASHHAFLKAGYIELLNSCDNFNWKSKDIK